MSKDLNIPKTLTQQTFACLKSTMERPEALSETCSNSTKNDDVVLVGVFIVEVEQISHILVSP